MKFRTFVCISSVAALAVPLTATVALAQAAPVEQCVLHPVRNVETGNRFRT
jgi:hypothetical protein